MMPVNCGPLVAPRSRDPPRHRSRQLCYQPLSASEEHCSLPRARRTETGQCGSLPRHTQCPRCSWWRLLRLRVLQLHTVRQRGIARAAWNPLGPNRLSLRRMRLQPSIRSTRLTCELGTATRRARAHIIRAGGMARPQPWCCSAIPPDGRCATSILRVDGEFATHLKRGISPIVRLGPGGLGRSSEERRSRRPTSRWCLPPPPPSRTCPAQTWLSGGRAAQAPPTPT